MNLTPGIQRTALAAALLLVAAAPAEAATRSNTGWWVGVDGWFAQPGNLDLDTAVQDKTDGDPTNSTVGGDLIGIDYGMELSGRLRFGWRDTGADRNSYFASYWWFDRNESMHQNGGMIPILIDPFLHLTSNSFSSRVESSANVKARILDLMLSRRLYGTKKSTWTWAAGLRNAKYEQTWGTDYFEVDPNAGFTFFHEDSVNIHTQSTGTGITIGLGSQYQWPHKIRTTLRVQTALLRGGDDSKYEDVDLGSLGPPFDKSRLHRIDAQRVFQQWELEARVVYNVWRTLDVSLGYSFLDWQDVVSSDRLVDDVNGTPALERKSISFDGIVLGAVYSF